MADSTTFAGMKTITAVLGYILLLCLGASAQFSLPPLPYAYEALEPFIDSQTMNIHHGRHHQAYVTNLNNALSAKDKNLRLEHILSGVSRYSDAVRNNAGGHYNHSLFWTILTPKRNTQPSPALQRAIETQFGSTDSLKRLLNKAAMSRFGSGWAWLVLNSEKQLFVSSTPNQDNPLMDLVQEKGFPLIGLDVWEHAYYLKYQNKRGEYLDALWQVLNWDEINRRYEEGLSEGK